MVQKIEKQTVFLGSGNFASLLLEDLSKLIPDFLIITQNNPALPVIREAGRLGLPIQFIKAKGDLREKLQQVNPELILVSDFGNIISKEILDSFPTVINIHPSLLPKYRGSSPIVSSIIAGDKETGVTLMKMTYGIDEGPIFAERKVKIAENDTNITLSGKLSKTAINLLKDDLSQILEGKKKAIPQDDNLATLTKQIGKDDGKLDLSESAELIVRKIRAYVPWPSVFTFLSLNGKELRVKITEAVAEKTESGPYIIANKDLLKIRTADGYLNILRLQPEGKREMSVKEFMAGNRNIFL